MTARRRAERRPGFVPARVFRRFLGGGRSRSEGRSDEHCPYDALTTRPRLSAERRSSDQERLLEKNDPRTFAWGPVPLGRAREASQRRRGGKRRARKNS